MPTISIVVPVYKVEKYVSNCIESILRQTYTDFQLILIDDGSPDASGVICDEYANKDDRIITIHQENVGPAGARNRGIEYVINNQLSEWITFIDSDDQVKPCYLEYLYEAAYKSGVKMSICDALFVDSFSSMEEKQEEECTWTVLDSVTAYVNRYESCVISCGKLYHISLLETERFPIGKLHEDAFFTYRILFSAEKVAIIDTPLYYYLNNPEGITHSKWNPKRLDEIEAHEKQLSFLQLHHFSDAYTREVSAYVHILACQLQEIGSNPEFSEYKRFVKNKLKNAIRLYRKTNSRRIKGIEWIYELGHPFLMQIYWIVVSIKRKMNRNSGLMRPIIRTKNAIDFCITKLKELNKHFDDYLSIVCIAKYEADYVKEWIDYHFLIGIDRIYFYDNESPDHTMEILEPYIESGRLVYTLIKGRARQLDAYNDAIRKYAERTKYMAFIDLDEFLVLEDETSTLKETIDSIMSKDRRAGGIAVNWCMYGSSGHQTKPNGLVIENFLYRGTPDRRGNDCIKTIANPRIVEKYQHVHYPTYKAGFYNIDELGKRVDGWSNPRSGNTKRIRINHYFTKSKEEWIERRSHGKADTADKNDKRTLDEFYEHDKNDVYDDILLKYSKELKD